MGTPSLVSYWRLGEAAGAVAADETGANPGSYAGGVTLGQPGALVDDPDTAASFDGNDDELRASGAGLAIGAQGTLEGWFHAESGVAMRDSSSGAAGWILAFADGGTLAYRVAGKTFRTSRTIASVRGGWHHFALAKSGSSTAYYLDGRLVHRGSGAPSTAAVLPWRVMRSGTSSSFGRGRADELAIYSSALSAQQVADHHAVGLGREPGDPPPPEPTPTDPPSGSGLKAIWGPADMPDGSSAFPTYEELGVDVFQYQVQWDSVAGSRPASPTDPADPAYDWPSSLDGVVGEAAAHGMTVALLVKGTPWWAVDGASQGQDVRTRAPSNVQDYADFLVAASRRYPSVRRWMVWGEPNRVAVWSSGPVAYSDMLDAAYGALKPAAGDPDTVVGGMTFTHGDTAPIDWASQMVRSNGQRPRLDEYGHNPFTRRCPDLRWDDDFPRAGARDISDVDTFIGELRPMFGDHLRFWLSEFTVSTDRANRAFTFYTSRDEQADWLTKSFRIAGSVSYVSGIGWYSLYDEPATRSDGLTTGLMTYEGERKPSFDAYKAVRLDGSQPRDPCDEP